MAPSQRSINEEWLGNIYGEDEVSLDRMILSTQTGILNQYAYYSPAGRDYIVEISVNMRAYLAMVRSPDYVDFLFHGFFINTINNNRVVDIDLFMFNELAKWSVLNEGRTMAPQAAKELSKTDEFRIEENNRLTVYSSFEPMQKEGLFSQRFATKVTYDISELGGLNARIALFSVVILLAVAPIAFLIVSFATNQKIIAPIQEITSASIAFPKESTASR